jgi:hypothetical protein
MHGNRKEEYHILRCSGNVVAIKVNVSHEDLCRVLETVVAH